MSNECETIHLLANKCKRHQFPFTESSIPNNGIYILFENGEQGHGQDRIVRIGTHTGRNHLRSRLKQHFLTENKDRSIFRKNIGRAILNKQNDTFLEYWNIDLTARKAKDQYSQLIDLAYKEEIEKKVSQYIRDNFSFIVFELNNALERLKFESHMISTVSICNECKSTDGWLGNYSPKVKIVKSGLWQVNELYKTPINPSEIGKLSMLMWCCRDLKTKA